MEAILVWNWGLSLGYHIFSHVTRYPAFVHVKKLSCQIDIIQQYKKSRARQYSRNATKEDFVINILTNQLTVFDTPSITPLGLTIPFNAWTSQKICAVVIQAESFNYCGVVWVCNSRSGDLENQWSDYYGIVRIQRCLERTYLKKRLKLLPERSVDQVCNMWILTSRY